ncbi:MAG: dTDP-4-dehydrorhamnose reductase [Gemmatimonadetes bacterium]|nr:dTDP-4-dehydrorhamnose reductase [Gemmatimonadota bacterium]
MRILVTGAAGLLGGALVAEARARGHEVVGLSRTDLDVTDAPLVRRVVSRHRPDAVVHCAAYTAVDRAESEPDLARAVNRDGARNVATAAAECGAELLYVSTDFVFDGQKRSPYVPNDETGPLSVYGQTKLEGEQAVTEALPGSLVVRTSWLYGGQSGFVPAILRRAAKGEGLRVVGDQRGRPTWAPDGAATMLDLLERGAHGVWHVAGGGECTWLELAREAVRLRGLDVEIEAISSHDFGSPARRPAYSVLDLAATEDLLGRRMGDWKDALARYMSGD